MDSTNGGQYGNTGSTENTDNANTYSPENDSQRQAAARLARQKVLAAYSAPNNSHMKDEPVNPRINSESWKRYHTAWQDYYQKYYSEYYSNAAREYIAKEQLKAAREQAEEDEIVSALTKASGKTGRKSGLKLEQAEGDNDRGLRRLIRRKATDNAKKSRRARHLIPLFAGLAVTLTILFLQYNRLIFAPIMAYVSPGNAPPSEIEALDPTITQTVSPDPRLIIPKLNVDVPINFNISASDIYDAMMNGVAHYRIAGASAYPGQVGNFVITGHSAGDVYSSNPYKYIFSGLERLEDGDLIYVNYKSTRYTYRVIRKEVVEPTNVGALIVTTDKPLITLVTCTPLGTSRYRLLVTGEQISPSVNESDASNPDENPTMDSNEFPSNEPSFFERVWGFLTGQ